MARLTKSAHFIAIQEIPSTEKLVDVYIQDIVSRLGVPILVVLDRDVCFTSRFWTRFHADLGTQLHFRNSY